MRVAFRADAGLEQGSGHVVRSLTLAREFEECGHEVQILGKVRDVPWLTDLVKSSGVSWQDTKENDLAVSEIMGQNFDLLVVDSYEIPADLISSAAEQINTLAIVDNQTRGISAQYFLDHNLAAREFQVNTGAHQLIGPTFALVRKEIRELRRSSSSLLSSKEKPNVLVMFGGTDPTNLSLIVSDLMRPLDADFDINFVAPQRNLDSIRRNLPENRSNIHKLTPKIQNLLAKADVVFSAAGTSVLDISCIGIPSIYICTAENQRAAIDSINEFELGVTVRSEVGRDLFGNQILEAINACLFDQQLRDSVFTNSQKIVDGLGAKRVVRYIEKTTVSQKN